jgi:hypothetical protein
MFPYFMTDNSDMEEVKTKRSVADMNKGPGDLDVALKRVNSYLINLDCNECYVFDYRNSYV